MDLFSAIETRTSCRQFLPDAIPPATIEQILAAGADVRVIVTSREPLGLPAEHLRSVPALGSRDDAVELFVERARQYRAILRAWRATREAEASAGPGSFLSAGELRRHAAPELGMWILDVDSMVAERCQERGMPVPLDLEDRIDIHLEVLRSALEG